VVAVYTAEPYGTGTNRHHYLYRHKRPDGTGCITASVYPFRERRPALVLVRRTEDTEGTVHLRFRIEAS
jgi:hypothetical protein